MTEIVCTAITAIATIVCACMGITVKKLDEKTDERAEQRAKEGRLQLKLIAANNKLTVGVAMALKQGHANGEVEAGLKEVEAAQIEYRQFLENMAIDQIRK